ncbi:hypothetical protein [Gaopeijia maritima]
MEFDSGSISNVQMPFGHDRTHGLLRHNIPNAIIETTLVRLCTPYV